MTEHRHEGWSNEPKASEQKYFDCYLPASGRSEKLSPVLWDCRIGRKQTAEPNQDSEKGTK